MIWSGRELRAALGGAGMAMLSLTGCSNGNEVGTGPTGVSTPATGESATTESTGTATTSRSGTTGTAAPASPLQRKDVPPQGIKNQFEFFQEGDGACRALPPGPPRALVERSTLEIGQFFLICFPGFAAQALDAEVRLPNGSVRRSRVTDIDLDDGVPYLSWYALPGDPTGTYTVSATQGSLKGTGKFAVDTASRAGVLVAPPASGPPGTTFRIGVFGFEPNATVPLYTYRSAGRGAYEYVTTLAVKVDAKGQTLYELKTQPDDPTGAYCFLHRGPKGAPDYACGGLSGIILQ